MSRDELRDDLRLAIIKARQTARDVVLADGDGELEEANRERDDAALGEVWRLLRELG